MFNKISKTVVATGVAGSSSLLLLMICIEAYKFLTLSAANYAQSDLPDILTRGIFIFFLITLAGLLGIAAQWLDRLSRRSAGRASCAAWSGLMLDQEQPEACLRRCRCGSAGREGTGSRQ